MSKFNRNYRYLLPILVGFVIGTHFIADKLIIKTGIQTNFLGSVYRSPKLGPGLCVALHPPWPSNTVSIYVRQYPHLIKSYIILLEFLTYFSGCLVVLFVGAQSIYYGRYEHL